MQEKLAILLSRKFSGEASSDELEELNEWIKNNPQDHYMIDIVQSYWHNHAKEKFLNILDDGHFERILNRAESLADNTPAPVVKTKSRRQWLAAAAVFLGLMIIAAIFINKQEGFSFNEEAHEVTTSLGAKSHIILPDGTEVWLNAATRLHYDKKFNGELREVYLEGEAYFDVKKDTSRPFIVHTSDIDIRVLGTAFNVKSYKEESTIEATLVHGSIQVTSKAKKGMPKIIMTPNEKLVFTKTPKNNIESSIVNQQTKDKKAPIYFVSKILPVQNDSSFVETAWVHNRLLFEGDTFKELAVKMERWYDVKIEFTDTTVANYRMRGVFEDESVEEALKALQQIANFNYTIKDKTVTVTK